MRYGKLIASWIDGYIKTGNYRDKMMVDKFMYIPNDDTQNYPFSGLVVETFEHST